MRGTKLERSGEQSNGGACGRLGGRVFRFVDSLGCKHEIVSLGRDRMDSAFLYLFNAKNEDTKIRERVELNNN